MPSAAEGVVKRDFKLRRWRGGVSTEDLVVPPIRSVIQGLDTAEVACSSAALVFESTQILRNTVPGLSL
jgi:hypothetical protein